MGELANSVGAIVGKLKLLHSVGGRGVRLLVLMSLVRFRLYNELVLHLEILLEVYKSVG